MDDLGEGPELMGQRASYIEVAKRINYDVAASPNLASPQNRGIRAYKV